MNVTKISGMFKINHSASDEDLKHLEGQLTINIPSEYRSLLLQANGFMLNTGLVIYSSFEVAGRNETFEVSLYAPGYIAIGDDSGGRAILISTKESGVFLVDHGSMDPDDFELISPSLSEWILNGCKF